jgi:hypothetical protein
MSDGGLMGPVSRVGALAALLKAIAESADDDDLGGRRWDSLARLVDSPGSAHPGEAVLGVAELHALRERPGDSDRAAALATAMLLRAAGDPTFRKRMADWRRQKQNQELESPVSAGRGTESGAPGAEPAAADTPGGVAGKPRESGWGLDVRLQVVLGVCGLIVSLLALKWPFLQAFTLAVVVVAGVVALHRGRGRSWRDRQVLTPAAACLAAAIVLIGTFIGGRLTSPVPASAAQGPGALPAPRNGSTVSATAPNAPARAEGVTPMTREPLYNEATGSVKPISGARLAELNSAYRSGSPEAGQILASLGAAQIGSGSADVTLVGNEKSTVTITGLQVVKHCQEPLDGTLFSSSSSGLRPTLPVNFDLDRDGSDNSNPFPGKVVTLAPGETFTLTVSAETSKFYCQFSFLMTVTGAYGTVSETIDDNGRPFALTAGMASGKYRIVYIGGVGSPDDNGNYASVNPEYAP